MQEILLLAMITGVVFVAFTVFLITTLVKRKKVIVVFTVVTFLIFMGLVTMTVYKTVVKSVNKISNTLKPRTGVEIYKALFGWDESGCVKIINSQDQIIPKIDIAIWLLFETCPTELKRILSLHTYRFDKIETASWNESIPYGETIDWLNPKIMGDTIHVFEYTSDDRKNIQTLWVSMDSTSVLCRDIFD